MNICIMLTYSTATNHSERTWETLLKDSLKCASKLSVIIKNFETSCECKMSKTTIQWHRHRTWQNILLIISKSIQEEATACEVCKLKMIHWTVDLRFRQLSWEELVKTFVMKQTLHRQITDITLHFIFTQIRSERHSQWQLNQDTDSDKEVLFRKETSKSQQHQQWNVCKLHAQHFINHQCRADWADNS